MMSQFINIVFVIIFIFACNSTPYVSGETNPPTLSGQFIDVGEGRTEVSDNAGGCGAALSMSDKIESFTSYTLNGVTDFDPIEYFEVLDWIAQNYYADYPEDYVYDDLLQVPLGFPDDQSSGACGLEFAKALCLAHHQR